MKELLYFILFITLFLNTNQASSFWDGVQSELTIQNNLEKEIKAAERGESSIKASKIDPTRILQDETIIIGGNEAQHMRNFKQIARDIQEFENSYTDCLKEISPNDFSEIKIDACLGKEFQFVVDDLDYLNKKMISKVEKRIRHLFIEECYKPAGLNEVFSNSCDLLEKDCLNILWEELNFVKLLSNNKAKYIFEYAKLDEKIFDTILEFLTPIHQEFWELSTEAFNHKDLTIVRIKEYIDDRTKSIVDLARNNINSPQPQIFKHTIEIEERVVNPNLVNVDNLPRPTAIGSNDRMYEEGNNPLVDEFKEEYGDQAENLKENYSGQGPTIYIPTSKKIKKD